MLERLPQASLNWTEIVVSQSLLPGVAVGVGFEVQLSVAEEWASAAATASATVAYHGLIAPELTATGAVMSVLVV